MISTESDHCERLEEVVALPYGVKTLLHQVVSRKDLHSRKEEHYAYGGRGRFRSDHTLYMRVALPVVDR